jgi:ABC-type multidrug transport system ATPase subunit
LINVMAPIIETEALTKSYGSHRGIVDVDLSVERGEVFGFLGPNGAGKTTTIRLLLDLIRPTRGRARVFGLDCTRDAVAIHRRVGYLPGELALYDRLTGGQTLDYFANLRGGVDRRHQRSLVERFDLDPARRSCPRRRMRATASASSRPAVWRVSTAWTRCATSPPTRWCCASRTPCRRRRSSASAA